MALNIRCRWKNPLRAFGILAVSCTALQASAFAQLSGEIEFNRDIRPILSDACFACHGPDKHARQADLRLDDRQAAIDSNAIVPKDAASSLILERIVTTDPELVMPPPKTGKAITREQRELLTRWINQGAEYQPHWAFVPVPKQVPVPQLDLLPSPAENLSSDELGRWRRSPIDAFVLRKMLDQDMLPAPQADSLTWLRRVSFDLTGLPPTPEMIASLQQDASDESKGRIVDGLLDSDAYAERMANLWLDVARYADTFGYQADVNMDVWPWRDWVIRAFRHNLPYDQFVTWQIAGDLLPNASQDQRLATTFNRLHRQTNEGGSIEEEFRQVYVADRTVTAGTAFLGLTLECSRCHDHKYDPISQKEFYSFAAYFADIDEHGLYSHFTRAVPTPAMPLLTAEQQAKREELRVARVRAEEALASWYSKQSAVTQERLVAISAPKGTWEFPLEGSVDGMVGRGTEFNGDDAVSFALNQPHPTEDGKTVQKQFGRESPLAISLWIKPDHYADREVLLHQSVAAEDAAFRGLQLVLDQGKPQFSLIHFWPGDAIRVESLEAVPVKEWTHLAVCYDGSGRAQGVRLFVNGMQVATETQRDQLNRDCRYRGEWGDSNAGSVQLSLGARFRDVGFRGGLMDELNVYDFELSSWEVALVYLQMAKGDLELQRRVRMEAALADEHPSRYLGGDVGGGTELRGMLKELEAKRKAETDFDVSLQYVMTMTPALVKRDVHILERGAYDAPREVVSPSPLTKLRGESLTEVTDSLRQDSLRQDSLGQGSLGQGQGRLGLAQWMLADSNPLTARVAVNRWWSVFFGRGIVATLEDFGSQGAVPTHPELLDWMARDFVEHGWDLRHLCKAIVLSEAYRQSSTPRDAQGGVSQWEVRDPENRYLFHGPRHRLSAEQVRDAALAVSGLLVRKVGGPSVMPYQPAGVWEEAGTGKSYSQAKGEGLYRRSMYTFWRRTAPPPSMLAFDATSRETCTARRETTTTPLQALVLLNDPQYLEAARQVALGVLETADKEGDSGKPGLGKTDGLTGEQVIEDRLQAMSTRILNRPLLTAEVGVLRESYHEQRAYFEKHPEGAQEYLSLGETQVKVEVDRIDLAAWSVVASMLMCFDDFVMKR
jgi:hypothetical protein